MIFNMIGGGSAVQKATGTVSGKKTITCGFKPDLVFLTNNGSDDGYLYCACFAFEASGKTKLNCAHWASGEVVVDCFVTQTATGFTTEFGTYDSNENWVSYNRSFNYVAVKYT